ncbi:putative nicotinate-nucleotide adenylyltransferase [Clostridium pasteurianum DSM 525 = ATCC 6013]|uniref:Probable nicotinate-nucleotide adenylyltransferase n=1 Tax=Clostridium pasteurianum DSM 525 = ATCC 6013 TaxID=1262449 RepID=A0A0H3J5D6_CLOPA|nr:nicotinate-nucleotide adenylyltransferase [Clostridium pasteurianum]AJA48402.1 putative nicotinate-nucleotide adenylyltransferase [Clostridium pasteurianum DSM 525 = ATCC 6013]AJA52390.1 putative nicotinate-nucleotide adenylyltransferase [Clostridium pasteurianum DSM 525 = ATCC 6013]AOZ75647.1 nicotinate-nucleotide adenylyltransferase [Clostridium pasteurianum DSM 525 = ATCC 6013]AOZ79443.1 nicotinate-nucleotide adenylyltransferase [Clostridium pasteurianum]ELP60448.1 nicotinic acid mononuc
MKKGILGGTFDPLHNGHLNIAYEAAERLNLDKIVFIPTGNPPHKKDKLVTDASIRYKMVENAIKDEAIFEIDDYEINKKDLSFTYITLEYLSKKEPNTEWYFISGADCLVEMESWKNIKRILELCHFVVFSRAGYKKVELEYQKEKIQKKYNADIILLNLPLMDISASYIREKIRCSNNISYLVPNSVLKDINRLKLYQGEKYYVE